jgi:hypothetical protein
MSARFADASVTHERALKTCEPNCVPRWGSWGTWQHQSSPLDEVELRAMGHMAAPEPTSAARRGLELRNTWQRQSSPLEEAELGVM